jgi:hypothetical protein
MKTLVFSTALILALLGAFVAPLAAAPWCADYCNCSSSCWQQCYDEGGSNACINYACSGSCRSPAANEAEQLLLAVVAPAGAISTTDPVPVNMAAGSCSPATLPVR